MNTLMLYALNLVFVIGAYAGEVKDSKFSKGCSDKGECIEIVFDYARGDADKEYYLEAKLDELMEVSELGAFTRPTEQGEWKPRTGIADVSKGGLNFFDEAGEDRIHVPVGRVGTTGYKIIHRAELKIEELAREKASIEDRDLRLFESYNRERTNIGLEPLPDTEEIAEARNAVEYLRKVIKRRKERLKALRADPLLGVLLTIVIQEERELVSGQGALEVIHVNPKVVSDQFKKVDAKTREDGYEFGYRIRRLNHDKTPEAQTTAEETQESLSGR